MKFKLTFKVIPMERFNVQNLEWNEEKIDFKFRIFMILLYAYQRDYLVENMRRFIDL